MTHPHERVVQPLLTDFYQISMAYAYWKAGKTSDPSVFDLFFRTNPFCGEFTVFCGLEDCLDFLKNYHFTEDDIEYLRGIMPSTTDPAFFDYLRNVNANEIELYAIQEGSVVFPRVPFIRIEGPLLIAQLLETTLLNLVNYASLVATNSARFRIACGDKKELLEFGLRRAQGPDGGLSASRYCYIGGFDATSNVLAGKQFGIPVKGTHAHAYVSSFMDDELNDEIRLLRTYDGQQEVDFFEVCGKWRKKLAPVIPFYEDQLSGGEYHAFISYAVAFPTGFLCLVDTFDVLKSGLPNFCTVALALYECGYTPRGVRIDSGDLAYLSVMTRKCFQKIAAEFNLPFFANLTIVASNDINEDTLHSLNQQGHEIDTFGIGTHLVTCQKQPALGCVYKLVEINHLPTIKLSEDIRKMTIPGKKDAFRLYSSEGFPLIDYMQRPNEAVPSEGKRLLCRHPFHASKRAYIQPYRVEPLYRLFWKDGKIQQDMPSLKEVREHTQKSLRCLRNDHKRFLNPTPYKVSVSDSLYHFTQELWLKSAPIGELS